MGTGKILGDTQQQDTRLGHAYISSSKQGQESETQFDQPIVSGQRLSAVTITAEAGKAAVDHGTRRVLVTIAPQYSTSCFPSFHTYAAHYGYDILVVRQDHTAPVMLSRLQLLRDLLNRYEQVLWIDPSAEIVSVNQDIAAARRIGCSIAYITGADEKVMILSGARATVYLNAIIQIGQAQHKGDETDGWSQLLHHSATAAFANDMCTLDKSWLNVIRISSADGAPQETVLQFAWICIVADCIDVGKSAI